MTMPRSPSVLLDANVLIGAFLRGRDSRAILEAGAAGLCRVRLCPYVVAEARRMIGKAFPQRLDAFDAFLAGWEVDAIPDASPEAADAWEGCGIDANDRPILAAAVTAGLDYFVTSDRRFRAAAREAVEARGLPLRVLGVRAFLEALPDMQSAPTDLS